MERKGIPKKKKSEHRTKSETQFNKTYQDFSTMPMSRPHTKSDIDEVNRVVPHFQTQKMILDPVTQANQQRKKTPTTTARPINNYVLPSVSPSIHKRGLQYTETNTMSVNETKKQKFNITDQMNESQKIHKTDSQAAQMRKVVYCPSPSHIQKLSVPVRIPSLEVTTYSQVSPRKPSIVDGMWPEPQTSKELDLHKPTSGITVTTKADDHSSFIDNVSLGYQRPYGKDVFNQYGMTRREIDRAIAEEERKHEMYDITEGEDAEVDIKEDKSFESIVPQAPQQQKKEKKSKKKKVKNQEFEDLKTSEEVKTEYDNIDETDADIETAIKWSQKFRRESEVPPPTEIPDIVKGTLESHSFTKIKQQTIKKYIYGLRQGGFHQGDGHFPEFSRNNQGIANSVAAYCYSFIKHPVMWSRRDVDEILESGDKLYRNSAAQSHFHSENNTDMRPMELLPYFVMATRKFYYTISEPVILGYTRSEDKTVYNLMKGLHIFFSRYNCAILQTKDYEVVIWKNRFFYFFDPRARAKDLYPDDSGAAVMVSFFSVRTVASLLLDRTVMGNWPYALYSFELQRNIDAVNVTDSSSMLDVEKEEYQVLSEFKAVVKGKFNLMDECFDYCKNKQALSMCIIGVVYSKITPSAAWTGETVNKVLVLGNQFYIECSNMIGMDELLLEHIPASFTIGPYQIELTIFSGVINGSLAGKKRLPDVKVAIKDFFSNNNMAILQYESYTYAIWKQRKYYYLFDPYSRDNEAIVCRNGTACVSMYTDLTYLIQTLCENIDVNTDSEYFLHAVKYIKIADTSKSPYQNNDLFEREVHPNMFKSITVNMDRFAILKTDVNAKPVASIVEIESTTNSLGKEYIPVMRPITRAAKDYVPSTLSLLGVVDLESPNLADTQIPSPRPVPSERSFISIPDIDNKSEESDSPDNIGNYIDNLLQEAMWDKFDTIDNTYNMEDEELELSYLEEMEGKAVWYEQSRELQELEAQKYLQAATNTPTVTFHAKELLLPQKVKKKTQKKQKYDSDIYEPVAAASDATTLSKELTKPTNFINLPDGTQIIQGTQNVLNLEINPSLCAPFISTMAAIVSNKYTVISWNESVIDYILKTGIQLLKMSPVKFEQAARHEIEWISLGSSDYKVSVSYVIDSIFKQNTMEAVLQSALFTKHKYGVVSNYNYSCAVLFHNHLYYLYDPYPCNKLGLGTEDNSGAASLMRFSNLHALVARILHNKAKREINSQVDTTRYMLSAVEVKSISKEDQNTTETEPKKDSPPPEKIQKDKVVKKETKSFGYQKVNGFYVIVGTKGLENRENIKYGHVKQCHFVCLCAMLTMMSYPLSKWDSRKIDNVLEQGKYIHHLAPSRKVYERRVVSNILVDNHFFDIIIIKIDVPKLQRDKSTTACLELMTKKHKYVLLQFPSCAYTLLTDDKFNLFDPYGRNKKAEWIRYDSLFELKKRLVKDNGRGYDMCTFYTYEVTTIRKAAKNVTLDYYLSRYKMEQCKVKVGSNMPFHEKDMWLKISPVPWSRLECVNAVGIRRGEPESTYKEWDVEFPGDLYSLFGNMHQKSSKFEQRTRGKQTLANCIIAIFMTQLYDFNEWNAVLLDSILINGDLYFQQCIKSIDNEEYEFQFEDLLPNVEAYPYKASVSYRPVVEGTMFVLRLHQFNLFKALSYFFYKCKNRFGVIIAMKGSNKRRIIAFGKLSESKYFMYDCQLYGPPIFMEKQGCSYILWMNSFNRLIHSIVLTLRGGDFYVYEVNISDIADM